MVREWTALNLEEKLEVLRLLLIGQTALGFNNLATLAEKGLASVDDIEEFVDLLLKTFEKSQLGDAADIVRFRQRLEGIMELARQDLDGE